MRLRESRDMVAVRTRRNRKLLPSLQQRASRELVRQCDEVACFHDAGVSILRTPGRTRAVRDRVREQLKTEPALRFAGRVLEDPGSRRPVAYTENLFVKFRDEMAAKHGRARLRRCGLEVKRRVGYAGNAFFVGAPEGIGFDVFGLASELLRDPDVELCHPELVRPLRRRRVFPGQWHLARMRVDGRIVNAHARVEAAWAHSTGAGTVIAVIDDGVDVGHREFRGAHKVVAPRDVTRRRNQADPVRRDDSHGTSCAGVACASGRHGAAGVAPRARLMPIRNGSGLGSQREADAIEWAVDHGADVISCSWGPEDGDPDDRADPLHAARHALPDATRLALEYATEHGRGGLGCVVVWAAGNGGESVDNDGYASFERVIAVGACNDRNRKPRYSDHGRALWCVFPSSDDHDSTDARTRGIWTTDRWGSRGYNPDEGGGDTAGHYTDDFGGTSSAAPGVAGVAALVLSANPDLRWDEVREILRRSCDRIDRRRGRYNRHGRSRRYGHGRLNARKAVVKALAARN